MLSFPNCKINIGLYITERRPDGYHNLETIFYPLQIKDALEIIPTDNEPQLHLSGKAVAGATTDNLVWKAWQLLKQQYPDKVANFNIYIHKTIPMGAGMGGGSADATFMLMLINDYCKLGLNKEVLAKFALQLGSDCPFFIYNTPQYAVGRGEKMEPVNIDLSSCSIQLICPQLHISTAKAFQMITPRKAPFDLKHLPQTPIKDWKDLISNDFETPVFNEHPTLQDIKSQLYNQGALYASMSGSGSAIYGIFPKRQKATVGSGTPFEEYYIE